MNMMNYHLNFAKELELEMTPNSTYNRTGLELELPENENKNKDHTNAQCEETLKKNIENEKKILDMEEEIKQIHKRITKIEEKVNENTEETQTNRKKEQKSNTILAKNNNNDGNSNSGNKNKTESPKKNNDGIKNTTERKTLNNNKKLNCYLIGDSHLRYIENEIKKDPEWTEKFNVKINFIPGYRLQDIADNLIPQTTAFYRLLPKITLTQEIEGEMAQRLQTMFSPGVISIEKKPNGKRVAKVESARYDSGSRNVFREDDLKDLVQISLTVESVGALKPDVLFLEAVKVLKNKCNLYMDALLKNQS
ncbi:hypothetical protein M8J75_006244 [Diaphorina citri]|nr:hypothetical protein M8J75_006244 [Diaphorina citri]